MLTLNELRLPKAHKTSFFEIPNYTFLSFLDKNNISRGGSGFYIRDDCKFQDVEYRTKFPVFAEVNVVELKIPFSKPMLIINIYNSPSVDKLDFLNSLNNLLIELSQYKDSFLIMGI